MMSATKAVLFVTVAGVLAAVLYARHTRRRAARNRQRIREQRPSTRKTPCTIAMDRQGEGQSPLPGRTPDSSALTATMSHRFTQKYLELIGMTDGPAPDLTFNAGALKGVQDAAESWKEFDAWLSELVVACPDKSVRLFVPQIGAAYEDAEMFCFTEEKIVTLARAKVTKVLSCGLRRADGTLILRALVEASDGSSAYDKEKCHE